MTTPGGNDGPGLPTQTLPPEHNNQTKQPNILGLLAVVAAVLGFIFVSNTGALIVGWSLLPIAFILGLVSLFQRGKEKWMGSTGLVLAVVGTIVGFNVFFSAVIDTYEQAFSGLDTTVVEPTRANPSPIGSVIENEEWRIVVNSVSLAATDAVLAAHQSNEPPADGSEYILVNYSATYLGDDPNGQMPASVSVEYVTADGTTARSFDNYAVAPDPIDRSGTLYTDGTATGNITFAVPTATAGQGVLAIRPGIGDKVFVAVQ